MLANIFRQLMITQLDRNLGTMLYDTAKQWLEQSNFAKEQSVKDICMNNAEMYFEKARVQMKFKSVEEMIEYYKKHDNKF